MAKVFIGVGHGGSDPGAVANGLREEDLNLTTALACNEELVRHGVVTLMSRTTDEEDTLKQEIAECNAFDPDLAVDLHHNAGKGDGCEVFHSIVGGTGKKLAENINEEIKALGQNSRGVKTRKNDNGKDYYGFIRQTKAPAAIVEYAFLDHPEDHKAVDTVEEQRANGVATAKAILKTLGIEYIDPYKVTYRVELGEYGTIKEADAMLGGVYARVAAVETALNEAQHALDELETVLRKAIIAER